jgi:hypothetical protein
VGASGGHVARFWSARGLKKLIKSSPMSGYEKVRPLTSMAGLPGGMASGSAGWAGSAAGEVAAAASAGVGVGAAAPLLAAAAAAVADRTTIAAAGPDVLHGSSARPPRACMARREMGLASGLTGMVFGLPAFFFSLFFLLSPERAARALSLFLGVGVRACLIIASPRASVSLRNTYLLHHQPHRSSSLRRLQLRCASQSWVEREHGWGVIVLPCARGQKSRRDADSARGRPRSCGAPPTNLPTNPPTEVASSRRPRPHRHD